MISALLQQFRPAHRIAQTRLEVCPPQAPGPARRFARELRDWLASGWPTLNPGARHEPATSPLAAARRDFIDAIDDIRGPQAERLTDRICGAVSLQDLWYLRAEVFALVAREFDQLEADVRLGTLSRHFPTRSPRSGFGAFDAVVR